MPDRVLTALVTRGMELCVRLHLHYISHYSTSNKLVAKEQSSVACRGVLQYVAWMSDLLLGTKEHLLAA
jgi:hypothetical protein